jgi:hypothetical protein
MKTNQNKKHNKDQNKKTRQKSKQKREPSPHPPPMGAAKMETNQNKKHKITQKTVTFAANANRAARFKRAAALLDATELLCTRPAWGQFRVAARGENRVGGEPIRTASVIGRGAGSERGLLPLRVTRACRWGACRRWLGGSAS